MYLVAAGGCGTRKNGLVTRAGSGIMRHGDSHGPELLRNVASFVYARFAEARQRRYDEPGEVSCATCLPSCHGW
jgi:hypothetical protein